MAILAATAWTAFAQDTSLDGDWLASLQTGERIQHLTLHVTQGLGGSLAVSLEGIGSTGWNYPGRGTIRAGHIDFHIFIADANFVGTLSSDARRMSGIWTQGAPTPVEFARQPGPGSPAATFEATPAPAPAIAPVALANLKSILDREMQPVVDNGLLSEAVNGGVVVGVLDHGQRRIFSYGSAQPDSIFEIASITKTFTGLALAQMVAQNKLTLDQPVRSLMPGIWFAPSGGSEITLLDLATHRSGLPSDPDNLAPYDLQNPYANYDSAHLIDFVKSHGLIKPDGVDYTYCNFGYGLLGYALAQKAGVSYEQLIKEQVTAPLHLNDTVVGLSPGQRKRLIQGYDSNFNRASTWEFGALDGEGGLHSTASDLLTYLEANLHPEKYAVDAPSGSPLATLPVTMAIDHKLRATADPGDKIAMAWFFHERERYFSHDGKSGGYNSRVAFYPDKDRAIVVLYNRDHLSPAGLNQLVNRISNNIEELMDGRPATRIDFVYQDERGLKPTTPVLASALLVQNLKNSAAVVAAVPLPTPNALRASAPSVGTIINGSNVASYDQFLPSAGTMAIDHGFTMRIVPPQRLDWSSGFAAETEKYSSQVGLDRDDHVINYVAGMPFPIVNLDDPKAAVKIAYNWHMGPFMPDDFSLTPWGSFAYMSNESSISFAPQDDNNYVCDHFTFLRYAHRTEVDPRPTLGANPEGIEWKARCDGWSSEPHRQNLRAKGIWVRYVDPTKVDTFYWYNFRRPPFGGNMDSWDALDQQCRSCHQPYWAYALPKTEEFSYRLLGTTSMLACLTAEHEPAGIVTTETGMRLGSEPFQLRHAYILEMIPLLPGFENLRTIVYLDTESYVWLGAEFFDGSEQTETAFPLWRTVPAASGGYHFVLAGEFYFPTGADAVRHAALTGFSFGSGTPKLFFRTLVPAHGGFSQQINTGHLRESDFDYQTILPH